jgi:hypothetical protein
MLLVYTTLFAVLTTVYSVTVTDCSSQTPLRTAVTAATAGTTITISCAAGTTVQFTSSILIGVSLTIDGGGACRQTIPLILLGVTFDGAGTSRIFIVGPKDPWGIHSATGITATMKNIVFKNAYADSEGIIGERQTGWGPQIKDASGNVIYWPIRAGGAILLGRNGILNIDSTYPDKEK